LIRISSLSKDESGKRDLGERPEGHSDFLKVIIAGPLKDERTLHSRVFQSLSTDEGVMMVKLPKKCYSSAISELGI